MDPSRAMLAPLNGKIVILCLDIVDKIKASMMPLLLGPLQSSSIDPPMTVTAQ